MFIVLSPRLAVACMEPGRTDTSFGSDLRQLGQQTGAVWLWLYGGTGSGITAIMSGTVLMRNILAQEKTPVLIGLASGLESPWHGLTWSGSGEATAHAAR